MDKFFSISWFLGLLLFIVICLGSPPRNPPGASPALAQGASAGGQPVQLELPLDYPAPLTYSERFSSDVIGPEFGSLSTMLGANNVRHPHPSDNLGDWAWAEATDIGCLPQATRRCLLSRAHVEAQGIGE